MKLSRQEKDFIDRISAISGKDPGTVKDIFAALLIATSIELNADQKSAIPIPYLFTFKINPEQVMERKGIRIEEKYEIETSHTLHNIVVKLNSGEPNPLEHYLVREISKLLSGMLDLEEGLELEESYKAKYGIQSVFG